MGLADSVKGFLPWNDLFPLPSQSIISTVEILWTPPPSLPDVNQTIYFSHEKIFTFLLAFDSMTMTGITSSTKVLPRSSYPVRSAPKGLFRSPNDPSSSQTRRGSYETLIKEFSGTFNDLELLRIHSEVSVLRARSRKLKREVYLVCEEISELKTFLDNLSSEASPKLENRQELTSPIRMG